MPVSKDKKTGSWGYNFMHHGVRFHRNFKGATRDEVIGYESIARAMLRQKQYDIAAENRQYMLSEIVSDYKTFTEISSSRSHEAKIVIDKFYNLTGNKFANDVVQGDIEKYRAYRQKQKCKNNKKKNISNSSINREVDYIRRCFSIAVKNRKILDNPCDGLRDLRIKIPRKRYLTKEEEEKLLAVANPIMGIIITVAIHTGMRKSEIRNLKWSDVFFGNDYLIALNTKNGKSRKLIITPQMREGLMSLPKISEYVFTNPVTMTQYKDFKSTFNRTVVRAGIPKITFHELRHTTASRLNELGVDIVTIQEYLDHKDIETTRKYIHKPKKNIVDAIERLSKY